MNKNITFVSMFFDIGRDEWKLYPRKTEEYLESFNVFVKLNYKMIVFIDEKFYETLLEKTNGTNITLVPINQDWLNENIWSWSRYEREKEIMESDQYKKLLHDRILRNYPENVNPKYTILTHSKIDIVNYVTDNNLTDDEFIAWVDFGYFYNKTSEEFIPDGEFDTSKLDLEKVNLCLINPIDDNDKFVDYSLLYAPEKIGAYFFFGNKSILKQFQGMCHKWLDIFQQNNIADDEQGLWLQCYFENPDIFSLHVFGSWHKALKVFSS